MSGKTFTYDSENHMTSMTGNGKVVTMVYDAFGNRVSKTVNGVTTQYLVEDDVNPTGYPQVVEELTGPIGTGVVTRTYTYGLQRISENLSPTLTGNATWTPSFYGYDGFGTVRQLTDTAGTVTDTYEYDAYGNFFTKTGTTPNNYLYRGEQYDSDLSLYYLRARYYNANSGIFVSLDPLGGYAALPDSLHKYNYALSDPVNYGDPTGRSAFAELGMIVETLALGPEKKETIYDPVTGTTVIRQNPQMILALQDLACANDTVFRTASVAFWGTNYVVDHALCTAFIPRLRAPNKHKNPKCGKHWISLGLDLLGTVPVEGNILKGVQLAGGLLSAGMALSSDDPVEWAETGVGLGLAGADITTGESTIQTVMTTTTINGSKMIPIAGNVISGISALNDIWEIYNDCTIEGN